MRRLVVFIGFSFVAFGAPAFANETVTYNYDAQGRLVAVAHSGTVNNNVQANYTHDNADNRTNVTVTGSPNTPPH
jgi:hypothetical protein